MLTCSRRSEYAILASYPLYIDSGSLCSLKDGGYSMLFSPLHPILVRGNTGAKNSDEK